MKARIPGMGGGAANMNDLMRQAQKMQQQMEAAQAELAEKEYTVSVGGGAIEITMKGKKEVTALNIKPEVVDPDDIEMLQDMLMGAVNEVIRKVEADSEQTMSRISGGAMPQLGL